MKYEFEVDTNDFAEQIVIQELTWHLNNTKADHVIPMFSHDPKEEKKQVKRLRNAFRIVLEYYGVKK
jgi:hypothetical protein